MIKKSYKQLNILCNFSLLAAALISGISFVAQKLGMHYVGPFSFNALRCFIGGACLFPLIFIFKDNINTPVSLGVKGSFLAGFVLFIAFSINQYCMIYADAGRAGFITSLYILFVPVIAVFLKYKLQNNVKISIIIALTGLYLLCAKDILDFELWDILLLISAFFFALHIIIVSSFSKKMSAIKLSCFQFLIAGLLSLPFALFEHTTFEAIVFGCKPILFIGVIVTGLAYTLQIFGHKATKPVLATLILSTEAVFAVFAGMLILGEALTPREITGCTVMFCAIILSQIEFKNKKGKSNMYKQISNQTFDEERSLYNIKNTQVVNCMFKGPHDGESVLKECRNFSVKDCLFSLRYPMWHADRFELISSTLDENTRAPIWYSNAGLIEDCKINGIKCLRECKSVVVRNCSIESMEFGWKCKKLYIEDSNIDSMYFLLESQNVQINNLEMKGKYSFQYMKNLHINNSRLDTKDAFWHSKNILVENSVVKGEYLGWFSENLTFVNCKIIGTQPLCYCKNLKLINCQMENTDLSFEYSDVQADINGHIISVKNPKSGTIKADSIGETINEDAVIPCSGKIVLKL